MDQGDTEGLTTQSSLAAAHEISIASETNWTHV
jgi:hypothetical protein